MKLKAAGWEIAFSLVLVGVLAFFLLDPYMLMPMQMALVSGLLVVFAAFAGFIWKEQPQDEREAHNRLAAGRWGFLVGAALLVIGIVWQSLNETVDPWLVLALSGMVLTKLAARLLDIVRL